MKDSYSLPRIEDTLDSLNGSVWFTALNLKFSSWQVEMDEVSKPFMAFTDSQVGFYECDHMSFNLVNAPATFQMLMVTCLCELQHKWCFLYLNHIIALSKHQRNILPWLRAVFWKLKEVGLKLKPSKWIFKKVT